VSDTLPSEAAIDVLFAEARSARIVEGGASGGKPIGDRVLLEVPQAELPALRAMMRIVESGERFHCMCLGDLAIELRGRMMRVGTIGFHHGKSIRVEGWVTDAWLVDGAALLRHLATKGVEGPLRAFEEAEVQGQRYAAAQKVWADATPSAETLAAAAGDAEATARVLFAWLAAGIGPWSGYPSYEGDPMTQLGKLDGPSVVRVAADPSLPPKVLAAAARFLGSHDIVSFRKSLIATVPDDFWTRARVVVAASGVEDDLHRFDHAVRVAHAARKRFGNPAPYPIGGDCTVVAESADGRLNGLATDGEHLYSADGQTVVRFTPGSIAPERIVDAPEHFVVLDGSRERIAWLCINAGTVDALDRDAEAGAPIAIARGQTRPTTIAVSGRTVAWISDAMVQEPGSMYSVSQKTLCAAIPGEAGGRAVAALPQDAWGLALDASHAWLFSGGFAGPGTLLRVALASGAIDEIAKIPKVGASMGSPILVSWGEHVLHADAKEVRAIPKRGGEPWALVAASQRVTAIAADDLGIVVLSGGEDGPWRVEATGPGGGRAEKLGSFDRRPYDRHQLVLTREAACFPCGDRVLAVRRG
jgi:hypothetical protein